MVAAAVLGLGRRQAALVVEACAQMLSAAYRDQAKQEYCWQQVAEPLFSLQTEHPDLASRE